MTQLPQNAPMRSNHPTRHIAFIGFEGVQALDLVGPMEVFAKANGHRRASDPAYRLWLASPQRAVIETTCGLGFAGARHLTELPRTLDTIIVAGGSETGLREVEQDTGLVTWLAKRAPGTRRMASVCTGAFLLGAAGLLNGKRATCHWGSCDRLKAMWPETRVEADAIFVADPPIYTSAGVTAGIDLCLTLVEQDCGTQAAQSVARELVLFMRRPGNQAQFSNTLKVQAASSSPLSKLISAVADDPTGDLRVTALAERAAMSERTFVRHFRRETGATPAHFVQQVRVERAKSLLTSTAWPLARIAQHSGFASLDSLHRAFTRHLKVTPTAYRRHFS